MRKILLITFGAISSFFCNAQNIEESLLLKYDLDGNGLNNVSSNYNLTKVGTGALTSSLNRTFNLGRSLYFDGASGLKCEDVSVSNQSLSQSVSLWFCTTDNDYTVYNQVLFAYIGDGISRFVIGIRQGLVSLEYGSGTLGIDHMTQYTTKTFNDGRWHHVVCISNGDYQTSSLFIDGTKQFEFTTGLNSNNKNCDIKVGGDKVENFYTGYIDDIRVYYKTLTETEISYLQYGQTCTTYEKVYNHISVTDELIINIPIPLSAQNKTVNPITIYPNPTKDFIYINTGDYSTISNYKVEITDIGGRIVFQSVINQQQYPVDLSTFGGKGTYIVNIYNESSYLVDSRKIILQ